MICTKIDKFDYTTCNAKTLQNRSLVVHELCSQYGAQILIDFRVILIARIMWIISMNSHDNIYGLLNFLVGSNSLKGLDLDSSVKTGLTQIITH